MTISRIASPAWAPPRVEASAATSSEIATVPTRLDSVTEHIAAGTLPPAIEVKASDDWIVEGSTHRNRRPSASGTGITHSGLSQRRMPISGNITKVDANTSACSRQWAIPAITFEVASRPHRGRT